MHSRSLVLLATLTQALAACAMELDASDDPALGVTAAALTTPTTLASLTADRVLAMGEIGAMFARERGENCAPAERLVSVRYWAPQGEGAAVADGTAFSHSLGCSRTIGIAADDMDPLGIFASDNVSDDIVRINSANSVSKIANTVGDARGRIVMDDEWVYWSDDLGIYKAMRAGGGLTRVIDGADLTLLGIDGETLVYKRQSGTQFWLRRVSIWGGAGTTVHSLISATGYEDLSFDDEYYYWVDNSGSTNHVRRLSRTPGSSSTSIVSSADPDTFRLPTPTDNGLFFVHNQLSGFGAVKIRRRSNAGNLSDQHTTGAYIRGMRADGAWLYWVEDFGATKQVKIAMYWF